MSLWNGYSVSSWSTIIEWWWEQTLNKELRLGGISTEFYLLEDNSHNYSPIKFRESLENDLHTWPWSGMFYLCNSNNVYVIMKSSGQQAHSIILYKATSVFHWRSTLPWIAFCECTVYQQIKLTACVEQHVEALAWLPWAFLLLWQWLTQKIWDLTVHIN